MGRCTLSKLLCLVISKALNKRKTILLRSTVGGHEVKSSTRTVTNLAMEGTWGRVPSAGKAEQTFTSISDIQNSNEFCRLQCIRQFEKDGGPSEDPQGTTEFLSPSDRGLFTPIFITAAVLPAPLITVSKFEPRTWLTCRWRKT